MPPMPRPGTYRSEGCGLQPEGGAAPRRRSWETGWAGPADEEALLALFSRAFGHAMPPEEWRWKYAGSDPWGALVRSGSGVAAFYGGVASRVLMFGEPVAAVQIGDVMVDPGQRGVMTRRGPFFLAASAFHEQFVGKGKKYRLAFGFPSGRVNRLAEHLGIYGEVGRVTEASWDPLPRPHPLSLTVRRATAADGAAVDALWRTMRQELAHHLVQVRDSAHIRRRFLDHPSTAYQLFLARRRLTGTPVGLVVLRDRGADGVELLDMVAPRRHLPALVALSRAIAARLGRPRLYAWLSEPLVEALAVTAPRLAATEFVLPASVWGGDGDIPLLMHKWWLMGGDSDYR